jgi:hypothetical protein
MAYFLVTLFLSCLLSIVMFIILMRSLRVNWERKNRQPLGYLSPVILTAVFLTLTLKLTAPCLLDTVVLITKTYEIDEVVLDAGSIGWNNLTIKDNRYFYNQWAFKIKPGQRYRISYTPRIRYIANLQLVVETGDQTIYPAKIPAASSK